MLGNFQEQLFNRTPLVAVSAGVIVRERKVFSTQEPSRSTKQLSLPKMKISNLAKKAHKQSILVPLSLAKFFTFTIFTAFFKLSKAFKNR